MLLNGKWEIRESMYFSFYPTPGEIAREIRGS